MRTRQANEKNSGTTSATPSSPVSLEIKNESLSRTTSSLAKMITKESLSATAAPTNILNSALIEALKQGRLVDRLEKPITAVYIYGILIALDAFIF